MTAVLTEKHGYYCGFVFGFRLPQMQEGLVAIYSDCL